MQEDFVKELGHLALAVRLKRISDKMIHSGKRMYKELGLDIEPNWFLLFKILKKHERLSVTEIADKLQFSHPSVINIVEKMTNRGYLTSEPSASDNRKRLLTLAPKALEVYPKLDAIWVAGTEAVTKMLGDDDPSSFFEKIENELNYESFAERTIRTLRENNG